MMKTRFALAMIAVMLFSTASLWAQEDVDTTKQEDMMAEYMRMAQPSEEHKLLESMVGKWELTAKYWTKPGAEPNTDMGKSVNKMALGGRFLMSEWEQGEGETQGHGLYILGFDRRFDKYTLVGFDTWGTYYITAAGSWDETTKTITMSGEDRDPLGKLTQKYDFIYRFVDDDTHVVELVFKKGPLTEGLPEFKMAESTFTRVK
jgi:hypothetical protein